MFSFYPATDNGRENGERTTQLDGMYLDRDKRPTRRAELRRYSNGVITKVWDHGGEISAFNHWDGETYKDPHFHSERCAAIHGRRMAKKGYLR